MIEISYNYVKKLYSDIEKKGIFINENDVFFKTNDGSIVGLNFTKFPDIIHVSLCIGKGLEWLREIFSIFLHAGVKKVSFYTQADNIPMLALAKYAKAKEILIDERYSTGIKARFFIVDITKRFKEKKNG